MALLKYFFLSDSWTTGRVWEFGGEWNERARRRKPHLQKQSLCIQENGETLWLFQAEDDILMLEVKPKADAQGTEATIGQVVLKRLLTADQVIERLCKDDFFCQGDAELEKSNQASLSPNADAQTQPPLHSPAQRNVLNEYDELLAAETTSAQVTSP